MLPFSLQLSYFVCLAKRNTVSREELNVGGGHGQLFSAEALGTQSELVIWRKAQLVLPFAKLFLASKYLCCTDKIAFLLKGNGFP